MPMQVQTDGRLITLDKDEQIAYFLGRTDTFEQQKEALLCDNDALVKDDAVLSGNLVSLKRDNVHITAEYNKLVELIKIVNARAFGTKSEKIQIFTIGSIVNRNILLHPFDTLPALIHQEVK